MFLNFNTSTTSENALFFADDKIVNLLYELRNVSAFTALVSGKTQSEIEAIAAKLGSLSHNNIGVIVDLLTSNDFSLLLEMDAPFVDFYLALRRGQYDQAEKFYCALPSFPPQNNAIRYKTEYERANLDHFLGKYEETYESLNRLMAEVCCDGSFINSRAGEALYFDIVLLQSHVLKHMGRFSEATQTLSQVGEEYRNTIWLRAHFSVNILQLNELTQPCPEWGILLRDLDQKMRQFKSTRQLINSDYYFYEAFYPIVKFYTDHFDRSSIPSLIEIEEHAIAYYEVQERRYLTNCYFIKAELLRISERWKEAEKYYNLCYDIYCNNGDKDILFLVAFTCKCVQCFEAVSLNIPFDWDEAISECKQRDGYGFHQRLISQMELAISNKDFCKGWLSHYRVTITPIP